ncbi:hypothetical protein KGQ64_09995 [bacterium]|nr:hypothetical protein [bacterium]
MPWSAGILLAALLLPVPSGGVEPPRRRSPGRPGSDAPTIVDVGMWPTILYNLDVGANSFYLAAYVWFVWNGNLEHDPSETVEFTNNVESWGLTRRKTYPQPILLPDGRHYQCLRIEGRFFHAFSLSRFPLEKHRLVLSIEDNTYPSTELVYRFDREQSGLDPGLEIPGWEIYDWRAQVSERALGSNLGDTTIGTNLLSFSRVDFEIDVERPAKFFYWKMLLPASIVMLATWMGLLLHPEEQAARAAMVGTALLSAVFLQQSYTASLPETNRLVLMDRIYVVVYALLVVSLLHVVFQGARTRRGANHHATVRTDRISVACQAIAYLGSVWWLIRTAP